jgi:hypothetical protein
VRLLKPTVLIAEERMAPSALKSDAVMRAP